MSIFLNFYENEKLFFKTLLAGKLNSLKLNKKIYALKKVEMFYNIVNQFNLKTLC